jgi:TolB-like protein/Tfp pilus assembly protein PilF
MLAAAGSWLVVRGGRPPERDGAKTPSIAVLPFANLSGDSGRVYFSDGLSEELLNVLAQIPELRVAARTSSFRFRGNDVPVDSIGKLLRVRHVLEGSVREDGRRVRITAQLIDTRTGYHLWSQTYDRDMRDLFAVQDEISRAIVKALQLQLTDRQAGEPLVRQETADPEAHALVLKGSHMLRTSDRASFARAAGFFEQAIRRDSAYARAHAGLATVLQNQAYRRYVPVDEGYARARRAAERALALDPTQIRAHVVLARIAEIHAWDFAAAEEHYRRAGELNPGATAYLASRAFLLMRLGRPEEAIQVAARYTVAEPDHAGGYNNLGAIYGYARRFERSLDAFHSALELDPNNPSARLGLALTYSYLERHDDAMRAIEEARRQRPDDQYVLSAAGYVLARAGRTSDADEALRRLRAQPDASAYLQAVVLAGLGRRDDAFAMLSRAVDQREDGVPDIGVDPSLDPLRDDPRMDALVRRVGVHAGRPAQGARS